MAPPLLAVLLLAALNHLQTTRQGPLIGLYVCYIFRAGLWGLQDPATLLGRFRIKRHPLIRQGAIPTDRHSRFKHTTHPRVQTLQASVYGLLIKGAGLRGGAILPTRQPTPKMHDRARTLPIGLQVQSLERIDVRIKDVLNLLIGQGPTTQLLPKGYKR